MHQSTIGRLVQPFAGLIDEVQIYPHALSAANINNYYLSTKDGLSASSMFIPAGIAAPGSTLTCTVIPSDSYGDGTSRSSNGITAKVISTCCIRFAGIPDTCWSCSLGQ